MVDIKIGIVPRGMKLGELHTLWLFYLTVKNPHGYTKIMADFFP